MSPLWIACSLALLAHNPDTSYLQVQIGEKSVESRLTFDIFTLQSIVRLDANDDGKLSRVELERQAPKIYGFLREHIWLTINEDDESEDLGEPAGFVWPVDAAASIDETEFHATTGLIPFKFVRQVKETPEQVTVTFGIFERFGDRHSVLGVFKLGEKDYELTFSRFEPDFTYVTGYQSSGTPESASPPAATGETSLASRLWRFFKLGVEHIFLGYDHICFLIALIVVSKFREVVKIVTSFTIAHSITLILATLDAVRLPSKLVETCIAATIVYVAVENLWLIKPKSSLTPEPQGARSPTAHRWWLTFFFGLVHGFGFAGVLRELGLPTTGLVRCLLSFNVGVEVGQLTIASALLPVAMLLGRWKYGHYVVMAISALLALFGLAWFIDRAFSLEFMPF